jgi:Cu(I)/Ag(I) efflux system membrane fusion protein
MFADLRIAGAPGAPHPLVPTAAIIADGVHARVIVALGEGRFKPVRVRIGRSADGMTAILAGLHGGERIVTSGQFLIDSEASLSGALERMDASDESSDKAEPSSGSSGHFLPKREGEARAMPGMDMPPAAPATSSHGAHP